MGPEMANELATNWIPNLIFFLVFGIFGFVFGVFSVFGILGAFGAFGVFGILGTFGVFGILGTFGVFGTFGVLRFWVRVSIHKATEVAQVLLNFDQGTRPSVNDGRFIESFHDTNRDWAIIRILEATLG
jgi:hypothetical protein